MGVTKNQPRKYFKISYGKVVSSVEGGTPDAVERVTKLGKTVYELIYDDIYGKLAQIKFREDSEFGSSWQISFDDDGTMFILQLPEDSKYCRDFLQKLPHLRYGNQYKFTPYEFTHNGVKKSGLNIYDESGKKIESFFLEFKKIGDKWEIDKCLHGYPPFVGDRNKKSDWKKYGIDVTEFLREFALDKLRAGGIMEDVDPEIDVPIEPVNTDYRKDDLPF